MQKIPLNSIISYVLDNIEVNVNNKIQWIKISFITIATSVFLVGCGGGGGGTTSVTTAPPVVSGVSNQLASGINLSGYSSLSVAEVVNNSSSSTRTALNKMLDRFASIFVKSSVAQATSCDASSDIKKLVGINEDGSVEPINVTTGGSDLCGVGFLDMFDAKNYILLVGEGIYKDDLTCNLVFVKKADGTMFCVGETQAARYKIKGSKNWSNYAVLQTSADGNYLFLEATAQIYKNNVLTGEITKILRFDLSDLTAGPKAQTVYEGYNTSWMAYGANTSGEYEGFNIYGYIGLDNGNMAIQYYRYVSSGSSYVNVNKAQYVSFAADGTPTKTNIDFSRFFGQSSSWTSIQCWMKKSSDPSKAYMVFYGPNQLQNNNYGWTSYGYGIYSIDAPSQGTSTINPNQVLGNTALCQNSYAANTVARRGDSYYSVTNSYISYNNSGTGTPYSGSQTHMISNSLDGNPDSIIPISFNNNGWGWSSSKIINSKDYLYVTLPNTSWAWWNTAGDTIIQVDPVTGSFVDAISASSSYLITSASSTTSDNVVKVTGRRKDTDDLDKFAGTIQGGTTPIFSVDTSSSTSYKPVTIIKL